MHQPTYSNKTELT